MIGLIALKIIAVQRTLIRDRIEKELHPDPPVMVIKGALIAEEVDEELDRLRKIAFGGKGYLLEIQKRAAEITGRLTKKPYCDC